MAVPSTTQFIPIVVSFNLDNRTDKAKIHKIYVYDIIDYPIEAKNIVISIKKI